MKTFGLKKRPRTLRELTSRAAQAAFAAADIRQNSQEARAILAAAEIGHNGGPPLDEAVNNGFVRWRWRKAYREAWRHPPLSILRFRMARAEAAGVTYRDYMLELLDTGRHLQAADVECGAATGRRRR